MLVTILQYTSRRGFRFLFLKYFHFLLFWILYPFIHSDMPSLQTGIYIVKWSFFWREYFAWNAKDWEICRLLILLHFTLELLRSFHQIKFCFLLLIMWILWTFLLHREYPWNSVWSPWQFRLSSIRNHLISDFYNQWNNIRYDYNFRFL